MGDPSKVRYEKFRDENLGTSKPAGVGQVNATKTKITSCDQLQCKGDAYIHGCIKPQLKLCDGILIPAGSVTSPSIGFIDDPDTGIYYIDPGQVAFTSNGTQTLAVGNGEVEFNAPITTNSGNLVINPAGPAVDLSGKDLINVGNISANANAYEVNSAAPVTTTNATPTVIATIPTTNDITYTITTSVAAANSSDGTSNGAFFIRLKVKNIGGTVTVSAPVSYSTTIDAALVGIAVAHSASGSNINIVATGLGGTTVKWFSNSRVVAQAY